MERTIEYICRKGRYKISKYGEMSNKATENEGINMIYLKLYIVIYTYLKNNNKELDEKPELELDSEKIHKLIDVYISDFCIFSETKVILTNHERETIKKDKINTEKIKETLNIKLEILYELLKIIIDKNKKHFNNNTLSLIIKQIHYNEFFIETLKKIKNSNEIEIIIENTGIIKRKKIIINNNKNEILLI